MSLDNEESVALLSEGGSGRTFLILIEEGSPLRAEAESEFRALLALSRVLLIETKTITDGNWNKLTADLLSFVRGKGVRQLSLVAFGAASTIAQQLALEELKFVRTMVLVNASTRAHPSAFSRLVDWLEKHLPLGLPLRLGQKGFDSRPFLQRIRCPVLISTTKEATQYELTEAHILNSGLPTSWLAPAGLDGMLSSLASLLLRKFPQNAP